MKTYALVASSSGADYRRFLRVVENFASIAGFVHENPRRPPSSIDVMNAAEPYFLRVEFVLEYPGAIGTTPVPQYLYKYGPDFIELLEEFSDGLFDWLQPDLPEDFHLLRDDESTVLGTASSEDHAYLRLTDAEVERWLALWPGSITEQE